MKFNQHRRLLQVMVLLVLFGVTVASRGATLEYRFTGIITNVGSATPGVVSSIHTNAPFTATFLIDLTTVVDRDGSSYPDGNYWALTWTNQVDLTLGNYQFTTKPACDHPATIQTHVSSHEVAFYAFEFSSPQFVDTGSGTMLTVFLRDETFNRTLPQTLPGLGELNLARWTMGFYNGVDQFSAAGTLDSVSVIPITPIPALQMSVRGTNMVVAWPKVFTNYVLETSGRAGWASTWTAVTNVPNDIGGLYAVTNQTAGAGGFFRLKTQ